MKKTGFTLVEVLISVTLIIIFSGMALSSYNAFGEESKLENEAQKFMDILSLASKKTMAGENPDPAYCVKDYKGFVVRGEKNPDQYSFSFCCQSDNDINQCLQDQSSGQVSAIGNYKLPASFSLETNLSGPPFGLVLFLVNSAGAVIRNTPDGNNLSSLIFYIKNDNINKCIPVTVNNAGVISEGAKTSTCP